MRFLDVGRDGWWLVTGGVAGGVRCMRFHDVGREKWVGGGKVVVMDRLD